MKQFVLLLFFVPLVLTAEQTNPVVNEHYMKGIEYYRANETEKARSEFLKALEIDKNNSSSKIMLAAIDREIYIEDPSDAFKDVVKELFLKGLVYYRAGDNGKALKEWENGLSVSPGNNQLKEFCGLINSKINESAAGAKEKQERPRKKTVKKEEKDAKTDVKKGKSTLSKSKISVDEKKVSDLYYEGLKLYQQGELKKAIDIWEQVLKMDPDLNKARKNLEKAKKEIAQGE